jgi:ABC-2 type transport system permease protein
MTPLPIVPKHRALDPTIVHAVRRHLRIWRVFMAQALVREMQFRTNFLATIGVGALQLLLALIPILLLYSFTDAVKGWSRADAIALTGMAQLVTGLLCLFVKSNADDFHSYIQMGALDLVVTKPMSAPFYLMTRLLQPAEIFAVFSGLAVLSVGLAGRGWPGPESIAQAVLLIACGVTMLACIWCGVSWTAVWTISSSALPEVVNSILAAGRYPVSFYPVALRALFVGVVPVAFATTFPVESLLGSGSWWIALGGIALTGTFLLLLRAWWHFAIRFYTSASS